MLQDLPRVTLRARPLETALPAQASLLPVTILATRVMPAGVPPVLFRIRAALMAQAARRRAVILQAAAQSAMRQAAMLREAMLQAAMLQAAMPQVARRLRVALLAREWHQAAIPPATMEHKVPLQPMLQRRLRIRVRRIMPLRLLSRLRV